MKTAGKCLALFGALMTLITGCAHGRNPGGASSEGMVSDMTSSQRQPDSTGTDPQLSPESLPSLWPDSSADPGSRNPEDAPVPTIPYEGTEDMGEPAETFYRVFPPKSSEVLINPGKGWILYDAGKGDFSAQTDATWAYGTLGYSRFNWSDVEKADGLYDFSLIDKGLSQCRARGKTYAFGIMACDPTSREDYATPKFILDRPDVRSLTLAVPNYARPNPNVPGGYEKMTKHIVDFTDPGEGYYRKLDQLAQALAERYGNSPDIEYIDIRGFGSWGENSYAWLKGSAADGPGFDDGICNDEAQDNDIRPQVMKRCWESYIGAFSGKRAQLMTAWGFGCNQCQNLIQKEAFYWAVSQGVGIRRDGYSGYNACDCYEAQWGLNKTPSALEMDSSYRFQKTNNGF